MSLGPDTCFTAIILSTTAWGRFLFLFYGRGDCAASGPVCPQIHLLKLSLSSLIWQGVLTPAGWFPLGLASGNALAWGAGGLEVVLLLGTGFHQTCLTRFQLLQGDPSPGLWKHQGLPLTLGCARQLLAVANLWVASFFPVWLSSPPSPVYPVPHNKFPLFQILREVSVFLDETEAARG